MLILARHGATELNERGILQGRMDPPLSVVGRQQASALADYLLGLPVHALLSSSARRAQETARIYAELCGMPVGLDDRFLERDFGPYEGMTRESLVSARRSAGLGTADLTQDWDDADDVEDDAAVADRVVDALSTADLEQLMSSSTRHVVVFCHSGVVKAMTHYLCFEGQTRHRAIKVGVGGVAQLLRDENGSFALSGLRQNSEMT